MALINHELDEVTENIRILIEAELETQHLFGSHGDPVDECPRCLDPRRLAG